MIDDRVAPRFDIDLTFFVEAGVRAHPKDTGDIVICKSRDLSETGLQIILDQPVRKGRIIRACMDIKDVQPIYVIAKVVWQSKVDEAFHHGLFLMDSPDAENEAWRETLKSLTE